VTQQNAALVEEAAAAAESLEEQAQELAKLVSTFRLGNTASVSQRALPAPGKPVQHAPVAAAPAARKAAPRKAALPAKAAKGGDSEWEEF
jgi:methyl-accepting chemotaxis protein